MEYSLLCGRKPVPGLFADLPEAYAAALTLLAADTPATSRKDAQSVHDSWVSHGCPTGTLLLYTGEASSNPDECVYIKCHVA